MINGIGCLFLLNIRLIFTYTCTLTPLKGLMGVLCVCFLTHQMNESCSCEPCAYEDGTQVHQLDGITVRDESYVTPLKVKHIALAYR